MSSCLLKNLQSSAFEGYTLSIEEQVREMSLVHQFRLKHREPDMGCTQIAWNKSGSTIAAAYGRFDHESWCTHKGNLCCWNISRSNADTPTFFTEVSSCLMCIAFHPEFPSIVAGGTFSGEISVWQTNESVENPVLASSKTEDISHEEPVSSVSWIRLKQSENYKVLSRI